MKTNFRASKFEKKPWATEQRPKLAPASNPFNDKPKNFKYDVKVSSFWGFKRAFKESPHSFFEQIHAEVMAEQKPKPVSTLELYEDEEFVVTRYSASSSKVDTSFSTSSASSSAATSVLNPEEL